MVEILSKILLILFIGVTVYRFYKHRHEFSRLSKTDWLRYLGGFLLSLAIGGTVIIGGIELLKGYVSGSLLLFTKIVIIFIGLALINVIFSKFIPAQLKEFYKL